MRVRTHAAELIGMLSAKSGTEGYRHHSSPSARNGRKAPYRPIAARTVKGASIPSRAHRSIETPPHTAPIRYANQRPSVSAARLKGIERGDTLITFARRERRRPRVLSWNQNRYSDKLSANLTSEPVTDRKSTRLNSSH